MQYQSECQSALKSVVNISKPFEKTFMDTMKLFMAIPKRINFLQLGRYGRFSEQTYRNLFENETFDWFAFNDSIISEHLSGQRKAIAIAPSYIPKSGHKTPWIGYFWSGCAGDYKRRCTEYEVNKGKLYGLRVYAKALKKFVSLSVWGIPWMEGQTSGSLTSLQTIQWMDAKFWSITGPGSSWNFALETASSILESPTVSQQTSESWLFISMRRLRLSTWSKRHARSKE